MSQRFRNNSPTRVRGKLVPITGLLLLLLTGLALYLKASLSHKDILPIRYVRVEGGFRYLDETEIPKALGNLADSGYFGIDLLEVERAARSLAWVDEVQVERIWPDILRLRISEQTPYFRWGDSELLNARGERFGRENSQPFDGLPRLSGPPGQEQLVYRAFKQLNKRLAEHGLELAALSINDRSAWSAALADGAEINMGRKAPLKAFDRFLHSLTVLDNRRLAGIKSVDLRYDKGFAVSWKAGIKPDWQQAFHLDKHGETRQTKGNTNQLRQNLGNPDTVSNKLKTAIWRKKPTVI